MAATVPIAGDEVKRARRRRGRPTKSDRSEAEIRGIVETGSASADRRNLAIQGFVLFEKEADELTGQTRSNYALVTSGPIRARIPPPRWPAPLFHTRAMG
jgi:hypothetical protein